MASIAFHQVFRCLQSATCVWFVHATRVFDESTENIHILIRIHTAQLIHFLDTFVLAFGLVPMASRLGAGMYSSTPHERFKDSVFKRFPEQTNSFPVCISSEHCFFILTQSQARFIQGIAKMRKMCYLVLVISFGLCSNVSLMLCFLLRIWCSWMCL